NVLALGWAVSPVTPSTFFSVALMALQHCGQQLWAPVTVRLLTLPLGALPSALIARALFPVWPWKPPAASASSAFWAVLSSGAVMVTVLFSRSHSPVTPSTFLRMPPTTLTQFPQHRWTPLSSTLVSARAAPAQARTAHRPGS